MDLFSLFLIKLLIFIPDSRGGRPVPPGAWTTEFWRPLLPGRGLPQAPRALQVSQEVPGPLPSRGGAHALGPGQAQAHARHRVGSLYVVPTLNCNLIKIFIYH